MNEFIPHYSLVYIQRIHQPANIKAYNLMKNVIYKHQVRGFTLLELMITVAILGILTAVAIPAYNGYITTAKMSEAHNNLAALRLAEEEYFLENNEYFFGSDTTTVASNSGGLWSATAGSDGNVNFAYAVSNVSSWTATASGSLGSATIKK